MVPFSDAWAGREVGGDGLAVLNPATGEQLALLKEDDAASTQAAIASAEAAWGAWVETTSYYRADIINRWGDAMAAAKDQLARLMVLEQGKPLKEAVSEVDYSISFIRWFAAEGVRAEGRTIPSPKPELRLMTRKMPLGVVAIITPWNFPAAMITRKLAPALVAGCTVVAKPAEDTPLTALALVYLAHQAGIPREVLHLLVGKPAVIGSQLMQNHAVRGLSFTGSTAVGKRLLAAAAESVKKCSMELGGNAPFIICEDADLDQALAGLWAARFRNAGQACNAPNRILVHESHIHKANQWLAERVPSIRVGNGLDATTSMGPLINPAAVAKYQAMLDDALAKGASVLAKAETPSTEGGCFAAPMLLSHATTSMRIWQEEIFAPILALTPFASDAEAIQLANATESGLASYLYTRSIPRGWHYAEHLEAGMMGINESLISQACAPFGGIKCSGLGREGSHDGLEEFLETQYLAWRV